MQDGWASCEVSANVHRRQESSQPAWSAIATAALDQRVNAQALSQNVARTAVRLLADVVAVGVVDRFGPVRSFSTFNGPRSRARSTDSRRVDASPHATMAIATTGHDEQDHGGSSWLHLQTSRIIDGAVSHPDAWWAVGLDVAVAAGQRLVLLDPKGELLDLLFRGQSVPPLADDLRRDRDDDGDHQQDRQPRDPGIGRWRPSVDDRRRSWPEQPLGLGDVLPPEVAVHVGLERAEVDAEAAGHLLVRRDDHVPAREDRVAAVADRLAFLERDRDRRGAGRVEPALDVEGPPARRRARRSSR